MFSIFYYVLSINNYGTYVSVEYSYQLNSYASSCGVSIISGGVSEYPFNTSNTVNYMSTVISPDVAVPICKDGVLTLLNI